MIKIMSTDAHDRLIPSRRRPQCELRLDMNKQESKILPAGFGLFKQTAEEWDGRRILGGITTALDLFASEDHNNLINCFP
jgi:hypothetical protein